MSAPLRPRLEFLTELNVTVETPIDVGPAPTGHRRIIPITGGTMTGLALRGTVLPGGADFQTLHSPELTELDARYVVEAEDGALIHVHNSAVRHGSAADIARLNRGEPVDPAAIYFRCSLRFSTASREWSWLNHVVAVGTGERYQDAVRIAVFIVR
ncbi:MULTISPECIES: DUF3237 domain-containing protein [Micrococcaceae]|uniref:DUF3237 domain-containing protein n=1 Tax=Micrococcaceae TaxID=1268 RepID=UPI0006F259B2|nr:DUF3237 domain-containing protein [Arthrobacter sp. Soil761]KRE76934.1 hypothetical protein ASG79_16110 [Arthrobacter sp. Soil761]